MEKISKSLTQIERGEISEKLSSDLILFTENLQNQGLLNVNCVTKLEELKLYEKNNQLTHDIINSNQRMIAVYLSECFPQIEKQLTLYWNAWANIFKEHSSYMNIRETTDKNLEHIIEIDAI